MCSPPYKYLCHLLRIKAAHQAYRIYEIKQNQQTKPKDTEKPHSQAMQTVFVLAEYL